MDSGVTLFRSRFNFNMRKQFDARYGDLIPAMAKFCLPGDVWKIRTDALIRYQPMITPSLTPVYARWRFFFVPLRQVEANAELIITGSKDGHLYNGTLPVFDNFVKGMSDKSVSKHSFWDYMGVPVGAYSGISNDKCLPAKYWQKGYQKIWWDFYRDENLNVESSSYADSNEFIAGTDSLTTFTHGILSVNIRKDYFSGSLPWQLKGVAPTISVTPVSGALDFSDSVDVTAPSETPHTVGVIARTRRSFLTDKSGSSPDLTQNIRAALEQGKINFSEIGIDADQLRAMFAQTRVFERLARTGSRYTEYLRANFGIAPADETLQRALYLGGYKQPIVVTEVVQTAGAQNSQGAETPVGTLRGHGISRGGNSMETFHCKEFGMLYCLVDIKPVTMYTQGISKEYSYKERFDFFNPSFQHLSEQEIKNGEIYIGSDGKNDDTFGFRAYAQELRMGRSEAVADMRDTLAYWNQAIEFSSRPNLNDAFIKASSHRASYNKPFQVSGVDAYPMIIDFNAHCDVYRPMVKNGTPGLIDHN